MLDLNLSRWPFLLTLAWRTRIRCPFCCNCRRFVTDLEIMAFLAVFKTWHPFKMTFRQMTLYLTYLPLS